MAKAVLLKLWFLCKYVEINMHQLEWFDVDIFWQGSIFIINIKSTKIKIILIITTVTC